MMLDCQIYKKLRFSIKTIGVVLIVSFLSYYLFWTGAIAQIAFGQTVVLNIPVYTVRPNKPPLTENLNPLHLRYLYYNPQNQDFKVLLDRGNTESLLNR
jgi:hypothetical protein